MGVFGPCPDHKNRPKNFFDGATVPPKAFSAGGTVPPNDIFVEGAVPPKNFVFYK